MRHYFHVAISKIISVQITHNTTKTNRPQEVCKQGAYLPCSMSSDLGVCMCGCDRSPLLYSGAVAMAPPGKNLSDNFDACRKFLKFLFVKFKKCSFHKYSVL